MRALTRARAERPLSRRWTLKEDGHVVHDPHLDPLGSNDEAQSALVIVAAEAVVVVVIVVIVPTRLFAAATAAAAAAAVEISDNGEELKITEVLLINDAVKEKHLTKKSAERPLFFFPASLTSFTLVKKDLVRKT